MAKTSLNPRRPPSVQLCDLTEAQRDDLKTLRAVAMGITAHIAKTLHQTGDAIEFDNTAPDSNKTKRPPTKTGCEPALTNRVVDGLERLAEVVIRIIDKEREYSESAASNCIDVPRMDEAELDRRIAAELDFIADQRRAAGVS